MANMITAQGKTVQFPRYTAHAIDHPVRGRVAVVRDNFPADGSQGCQVFRRQLADGEGYVPALNGGGFVLTGPWMRKADGSYAASCEPV